MKCSINWNISKQIINPADFKAVFLNGKNVVNKSGYSITFYYICGAIVRELYFVSVMDNFLIAGIQQVGVGTTDFRKSWNWYIEMFGIDIRVLEDNTVAERMLRYTGGVPQKRHACVTVSLQGGGGLEVWQYSEREPKNCDFDISVGDLGIFATKIKCRDAMAFHAEISAKWHDVGPLSVLPDGTVCFFVKDLYGNYFQIVETGGVFIEQHRLTGGVEGAVIGVSDIDSSVRFYSGILGYDKVVYDYSGKSDDWGMLPAGGQNFRRVLLTTSKPRKGAFSGFFISSSIELVQALERTPRKIYEGRYWGDPGFIQVCFDVTGIRAFGRFCEKKGYPFTVDSCPGDTEFDMGDASGHFTYIEDPDGTLLEFVETHRIPIVKKIGWYLNMKKRDPEKRLPRFLFRMMGLAMREKVS